VDGRVEVPARLLEERHQHVGGGARFDGVIVDQRRRLVGGAVGRGRPAVVVGLGSRRAEQVVVQAESGTADAGAHVEHAQVPREQPGLGDGVEGVLHGGVEVRQVVDGVAECCRPVVRHVPVVVVVRLQSADPLAQPVTRLAGGPLRAVCLREHVGESTVVADGKTPHPSDLVRGRRVVDRDESAVRSLHEVQVGGPFPQDAANDGRMGVHVARQFRRVDGPHRPEVAGAVYHRLAVLGVHRSSRVGSAAPVCDSERPASR
jgi:hypothetical protein